MAKSFRIPNLCCKIFKNVQNRSFSQSLGTFPTNLIKTRTDEHYQMNNKIHIKNLYTSPVGMSEDTEVIRGFERARKHHLKGAKQDYGEEGSQDTSLNYSAHK